MKLYRYRPLSEFLFKELYYQELYLASYPELNDPLDMNTLIDFSVSKVRQVEMLSHFLIHTSLVNLLGNDNYTEVKTLTNFINDKTQFSAFNISFFNYLLETQNEKEYILLDTFLEILENFQNEYHLPFKFDTAFIKQNLERLTAKFFHHSCVACFSESNSDFLMWSHYANKHTGICVEYSIETNTNNEFVFLYEFLLEDKDSNKYEKILCEQKLHKVNYDTLRQYASFFDFLPIFNNENDCDVINLDKSYLHKYAWKIEDIFINKTEPWKYEQEWRIIEINFDQTGHCEERIRHYPISAVSAIYFGMRTPDNVKKRIHNIYKEKWKNISYYDCLLTNGREIKFQTWTNENEDDY